MVVLGVLAMVLVGCQAMTVPGAEITEEGLIQFTAQGTSVIDQPESAWSKQKAYVAAETIAKANLLELVKGARVEGSAQVADLMFVSQEAAREVDGWLGRAKVTFSEGPEGTRRTEKEIVTATATLTLDEGSLANLDEYAE